MNDNNEYPNINDTIHISNINYDIMSYLDRTNRQLLVTLNNGKQLETSVGKCYDELIFHSKFPMNLDRKDIAFVKIIG